MELIQKLTLALDSRGSLFSIIFRDQTKKDSFHLTICLWYVQNSNQLKFQCSGSRFRENKELNLIEMGDRFLVNRRSTFKTMITILNAIKDRYWTEESLNLTNSRIDQAYVLRSPMREQPIDFNISMIQKIVLRKQCLLITKLLLGTSKCQEIMLFITSLKLLISKSKIMR